MSAVDNCINKIREISLILKNGGEIIREQKPKELSVIWSCLEPFQEWRMGYNIMRALANQCKNDPRSKWIMVFMTGHMNATSVLEEIDKLENLKAFW